MRALIVVESMFGNTQAIAQQVAAGLRRGMTVDIRSVADAPTDLPADLMLLVVGGPTHAFGMTRPSTREDAIRKGAVAAPLLGIREWISGLDRLPRGMLVTAFDTRIARPRLPGSAAHAAGRRLVRHGGTMVTSPTSFYVADTAGPLTAGETERAEEWGRAIVAKLRGRGLSVAS